WIDKHNRYAVRQAREEEDRLAAADTRPARAFGSPDERTRWQKNIWYRLPIYVRPFFYFIYRYLFRLGFLDGKQRFLFHFVQAFWYRLLDDINRDEIRRPGLAGRTMTAAESPKPGTSPRVSKAIK